MVWDPYLEQKRAAEGECDQSQWIGDDDEEHQIAVEVVFNED